MKEDEMKLMLMQKDKIESEIWETHREEFKKLGLKGGFFVLEGLMSRIGLNYVCSAENTKEAVDEIIEYSSSVLRYSLMHTLFDLSEQERIDLYDDVKGWLLSRDLE